MNWLKISAAPFTSFIYGVLLDIFLVQREVTDDLCELVVRKLKKKDRLKSVGKWECEVGQDWSSSSSVEVEGISESAGNVSVHYSLHTTLSHQIYHRSLKSV